MKHKIRIIKPTRTLKPGTYMLSDMLARYVLKGGFGVEVKEEKKKPETKEEKFTKKKKQTKDDNSRSPDMGEQGDNLAAYGGFEPSEDNA